MAKRIAITDTTFLVYSTLLKEVDLLKRLRILFDHILLPGEVIKEFTPKENRPENRSRQEILAKVNIHQGFYRLCTSFDAVVLDALRFAKNVDAGEAETIAQAQHRKIPFILTDEKRMLKHLPKQFSHLRFYSTITIIAILDLNGFIPNYEDCIRELHSIRKFHSKDLRQAYEDAIHYTQRRISGKALSAKISLKKILSAD